MLLDEGFKLSPQLGNGELGVDIIASKRTIRYYIEVIGYRKAGPTRSRDFYEVFFRAISRLNDGANKIVIALPIQFRVGFRARVNQYRIGWERISKVIPELNIWFVDIENHYYKRTTWRKCLKI